MIWIWIWVFWGSDPGFLEGGPQIKIFSEVGSGFSERPDMDPGPGKTHPDPQPCIYISTMLIKTIKRFFELSKVGE